MVSPCPWHSRRTLIRKNPSRILMAKKTKKPAPAKKMRQEGAPTRSPRIATCSPASMAARPAKSAKGKASALRRRRLYRPSHRGAGGAGAGAAASRHVYRRHRREGAASPVRRSDRQCDGRSAGRPRDLHRGRTRRRRLYDRAPTTAAAFRSIRIRNSRKSPRSKSSCARCMPAANSIPRSMRPRAACTASACRWSTRCRKSSKSRSRADSSSIA